MLDNIKNIIKVIVMRISNKRMRISLKARIGKNVFFEGNNLICKDTKISNLVIGNGSYIAEGGIISGARIGRYTSIGPRCRVVGGNHPTSVFVSTHPAFYTQNEVIGFSYVRETKFKEFQYADEEKKYKVIVGNDVWIASDVILLPGVKIGDGAVIAAGAVVTKDVEPYAIVGGIPAKVIKYRFEKEDIEFLLNFKWWDKDEAWIKKNAKYFDDIRSLRAKLEVENE